VPKKIPTRLAASSLLLAFVACFGSDPATRRSGPGPVVREQRLGLTKPHLQKLALAPLTPAVNPTTPRNEAEGARGGADFVTRSLSEALTAEGVLTVPPTDVALALRASGIDAPADDAAAAAQSVARKFAATGLMVGRVSRYRDREGGALATAQPASVSFEVQLYSAPDGKHLWSGRFSHTQQTLTYKPLEATRYPGGGLRWLSALELSRWGAQNMARSLVAKP
jgi:hypothetical protein